MAENPESADKPLKLRAHDPADMDVVAALLQDALVPLGDMTYLAKEKRFVMVANRFRWHGDASEDERPAAPPPQAEGEDVAFAEGDDPPFERVNSGLCSYTVRRVPDRGMEPGHHPAHPNLTPLHPRPAPTPP